MKFSLRFYCLFALVGIVFLALVLLVAYLDTISSLGILGGVLVFLSFTRFGGFFFVLVGIAFLTVGIVGIERHCFKRHGKLLSEFSTVFVPLLTFVTFLYVFYLIFVIPYPYPMRSEITQVAVVDINPLVLNLHVRAVTSSDTRIQGAFVLNNSELVAQIPSEAYWFNNRYPLTLAELPAGSEITLTLNFDTALPSGSYLVRLTCWRENHGDSPFTIP